MNVSIDRKPCILSEDNSFKRALFGQILFELEIFSVFLSP